MKNNTIQTLIQMLNEEYIIELHPSPTNLIYQAFKNKKYNLAIMKYLHMRDCSLDFKKIITPDVDLYNFIKISSQEEELQMRTEIDNVSCPHCETINWNASEYDYDCDNCGKSILVETKIQLTITPTIDLDLYDLSNKIDITIENKQKIPKPAMPLPNTEVTEDSLIIDFMVDVYVQNEKSRCIIEDFNLNCDDLNLSWVKFQVVEN